MLLMVQISEQVPMTQCVHMHRNVCVSCVLPRCRLGSRPAVEMSVGAASLPGHRPADLQHNLLGLHAESDLSQ